MEVAGEARVLELTLEVLVGSIHAYLLPLKTCAIVR